MSDTNPLAQQATEILKNSDLGDDLEEIEATEDGRRIKIVAYVNGSANGNANGNTADAGDEDDDVGTNGLSGGTVK